jgi:hypothetical protein
MRGVIRRVENLEAKVSLVLESHAELFGRRGKIGRVDFIRRSAGAVERDALRDCRPNLRAGSAAALDQNALGFKC